MLRTGNRQARIHFLHNACALLALFFSLSAGAQPNPTLVALDSRQFKQLDANLNGLQARFEAGQATEVELRDAFRAFYELTPLQEAAVREWVRSSPNSYSAHLALGVFLRRKAGEARGNEYINKTPQEKISRMIAIQDEALPEFERALALTPKPYLAAFHLLNITALQGDRAASKRAIKIANKALPSNHLARGRYMVFITPRWGGSYLEMRAFMAQSKSEGLDEAGLMQLEAIMYNDMGKSVMEKGDSTTAYSYFKKALELDKQNGGIFRKDFLATSDYYVCRVERDSRYCN